ncbi:uncharacterized protein Dyak_GE28042 [Drosophila yakuba]|uniref:Uncharacterized protein n=1 Tax=Drosophila yakuba TaxID=7245 RepID=A0A0R1E8U2_DROYA|nr:uncharacterized protein Dyak_GE28042 [Drosophila yakuba]
MRRASADLEKRRASVGAAGRGLRGDGTLDPHHAAILFRDSRGLPVADPFLEKVNLSDLGKFSNHPLNPLPCQLFRNNSLCAKQK